MCIVKWFNLYIFCQITEQAFILLTVITVEEPLISLLPVRTRFTKRLVSYGVDRGGGEKGGVSDISYSCGKNKKGIT